MRWWPPWPAPPEAAAGRGRRTRLQPALRADTSLAVALAFLTAALYLGGLFERLELIAIDQRYQRFPAPVRPDILLVLIDSDSLKRVGQWPWSRREHARLVRWLGAAGARAIGYDVEFGKPRDAAGDRVLAAAVGEAGNVVLAVFHEYQRLPDGTQVYRASPLLPDLQRAGAAAGTISFPTDAGGGVRRAPLAEDVGGDPHWSFAVEVARRAEGLSPGEVHWSGRGRLRLGGWTIRSDAHRLVYIDYAGGRRTFPGLSARDVLEGRVRPEVVRGKVVLVGASAIELLDLHHSPFPGVMPGVEIQANLVNGFLRGAAARRLPPWSTLLVLGVLAAAWPSAARRVARGPARMTTRGLRILAAGGVAAAGIAAAAALVFWQWRIFLDVVPLLAAAGAMGVGTVVVESVRTGRRAALSTVALTPPWPGEAGSPLDQAVDVMFAALRDWMAVEVLVIELRRGMRRPGVGQVVRRAGAAPLGAPSEACREWAHRAFAAREGFLASHLGEVFGPGPPGAAPTYAAGSAFVPLLAAGRGVGVLQAHRRSGPFEGDDLRVLEALAAQLALAIQNLDLLQDHRALYLGSIAALADAVEAKDAYTGGHCKRVSDYSVRLAEAAGVPPSEVEEIRFGSLIHDIGKIGISEGILGKAANLTEVERGQMQQHTVIGERIISHLPVSQTVRDIIMYHHERYNGAGYPRGLRGDAIPMAARIVAVADAYEALTSGRTYRRSLGEAEARGELRRAADVHLDPYLVELFLHLLETEGVPPQGSPPVAPGVEADPPAQGPS